MHFIHFSGDFVHGKENCGAGKENYGYIYGVMAGTIIISKGGELLRIPADRLMYVTSDGNYSNVVNSDGHTRLVTYQLGQIEDAIISQLGDEGMNFLRLGRGLIVNTAYIYFVDVTRQQLIMSNFNGIYHELSASKAVLSKLAAYIGQAKNINGDE